MPVLNIKDPEAHRLASKIAKETGKSLTRVVVDALRAENTATRPAAGVDLIAVETILARMHAKLDPKDNRTPDETIGYDKNGLPV